MKTFKTPISIIVVSAFLITNVSAQVLPTTINIHYTFDTLNRVDTARFTFGANNYLLDYAYFKNDLRKQLVYPSGKVLDYTYDADDRMDLLKLNGTTLADYNHDPLDRPQTKTLNTGSSQQQASYSWDIANQLTNLANTLLPAGGISQYGYSLYDNVGNRKSLTRAVGATPAQTFNYAYNAIYELVGVTGAQTHSFAYDALGNRTTANGTTYTANNLNQYTSVGPAALSYDANGNLTSDGTNTYAYDEENRLASMSRVGFNATYAYDAFNRRVSKTVNGTATYFVYDGDEAIADYTTGGGLMAEYIYGQGLDEVLTMQKPSGDYYYHYDGLGSVTEVTDNTGALAERYEYDPYGKPTIYNASGTTIPASAIGNRYLFTGREWDQESNTYHYRARQYDPTLGRFLQRDPIGYYDSMNLYQYVQNSPVNWIDPFGECALPLVVAGAEALGAAAEALGAAAALARALAAAAAAAAALAEAASAMLRGHSKKKQSTGSFKGAKKEKHQNPRPGRSTTKQRQRPTWKPWNT